MICCSCGKEIDINYGREYWDGIYCKKCADEILFTPEYIKNYEKIIADLKAENATLRERLKGAVELPFKVGSAVYRIQETDEEDEFNPSIDTGKVVSFSFDGKLWIYVQYSSDLVMWYTLDDFNKEVYTALEAAEAVLRELRREKENEPNT